MLWSLYFLRWETYSLRRFRERRSRHIFARYERRSQKQKTERCYSESFPLCMYFGLLVLREHVKAWMPHQPQQGEEMDTLSLFFSDWWGRWYHQGWFQVLHDDRSRSHRYRESLRERSARYHESHSRRWWRVLRPWSRAHRSDMPWSRIHHGSDVAGDMIPRIRSQREIVRAVPSMILRRHHSLRTRRCVLFFLLLSGYDRQPGPYLEGEMDHEGQKESAKNRFAHRRYDDFFSWLQWYSR